MKVKLDKEMGAKMPTKAHEADGGFDLYSTVDKVVPAMGSAEFDTGVHMCVPVGYVGLIESKSGLNIKHDLVSFGVVDALYSGSIRVKLYNLGDKDYTVAKGDKISQILITPILPVKLEETDELWESERGSNGFGSSGK